MIRPIDSLKQITFCNPVTHRLNMHLLKLSLFSFLLVSLATLSGCADQGASVVQPDPETRTYPQSDPGESMDEVQ
ncbi:secreted protein [Rhodopirellula sallentina SM41]|uniref:Secreted protein n=2 Tax=Rhodopirellula TaxID=265488 RepID=M5UBU1_9BACT|nr:secreted protein [Rhodopirellula sallentina SM41]